MVLFHRAHISLSEVHNEAIFLGGSVTRRNQRYMPNGGLSLSLVYNA